MKKIFLQTILLCCCGLFLRISVYGQYNHPANSNWMFADSLGINFVNGTPVTLSSVMTGAGSSETAASISNNAGELLFYTDGDRVYDRNHNLMPNGNLALLYASGERSFSVTQGALIIPFPNDSNKYYLFTQTNYFAFFILTGSWYYSVVDMSLNGGLGDIVSGYPLLLESSMPRQQTEKMIAIAGDDCNIWVLRARGETATSEYVAYEINANGLNTTPVISSSSKDLSIIGAMAISHDRTKLATANYNLDFYSGREGLVLSDFDPATGAVSNSYYLDSNVKYYGVCFSPDNTKLYATLRTSIYTGDLYQFDLVATNPSATKTLIAANDNAFSLQLGADNRIYVANTDSTIVGGNGGNIGVINAPNLAGVSCNYNLSGLTNKKMGSSFQNLVVTFVPEPISSSLDSLVCENDWNNGISIKANVDTNFNYTWSTGDTSNEITVYTPDTYTVVYGNSCVHYVDTFILKSFDLFTTVTIDDVFELSTTGGPFATYQWFLNGQPIAGATNSSYLILENGNYQVEVTNEFGCVYLSDPYKVTNYETSVDHYERLKDIIQIYPNPSEDVVYIKSPMKIDITISSIEGKQLVSFNNIAAISLKHFPKGIYLMQFVDQKGRIIKIEKVIKQ